MDNNKAVIYNSLGVWYYTPEDNYNCRIRNERRVHRMDGFGTADEVAEYLVKYLHYSPEEIIVKGGDK